jgi:hypothetical protein
MLPNELLPNQQYNLCLEKKQVQDGVYEEASKKVVHPTLWRPPIIFGGCQILLLMHTQFRSQTYALGKHLYFPISISRER